MNKNNIIDLKKSEQSFSDCLTDLLRVGAQQLLTQAVKQELDCFLIQYQNLKLSDGRAQIVRNGHLPERDIQTGIGPIAVQVPRTRDRHGRGIRFHSELLPPYLKRTKSLNALLPYLYLKGISTNDFSTCMEAILGKDAHGLSASNIGHMTKIWQEDLETFHKRSLKLKRYVYFWVDGVYLSARQEQKQCVLVIIGADETGRKELVAMSSGYRESELSWKNLLLGLKDRGLIVGPHLCIGDGALGFWAAITKVYPEAQHQRCWVHKSMNVLNSLPDSLQVQAKSNLHDIWMKADTKEHALKAFDKFVALYADKYPKAVHCLQKDKDKLLTFFNYPGAHWRSIRTTNPIESTFATVKHRTIKTKGCLSIAMVEIMTFKLIQAASKNWIKLYASKHLTSVIQGMKFNNGVEEKTDNLNINEQQSCAA